MADTNPYSSPQEVGSETPRPPTPKRSVKTIVTSSFIGGIVGSVVLAPITRGPGDPTGHIIGAGLGGFSGLFVGLSNSAITHTPSKCW